MNQKDKEWAQIKVAQVINDGITNLTSLRNEISEIISEALLNNPSNNKIEISTDLYVLCAKHGFEFIFETIMFMTNRVRTDEAFIWFEKRPTDKEVRFFAVRG